MKKVLLKIGIVVIVLVGITLPLFFLIGNSGNKKLKHPIEITTNGKFNKDGWANEDFSIQINTKVDGFLYCIGNEECTPSTNNTSNFIELPIQEESDSIYVCAKLISEEQSQEVVCSKKYKLDKTKPEIGELTITGTKGSNDWYISDVTFQVKEGQDSLSGHKETKTNVTEIKNNTSGQVVILTTTDNADNTVSQEYTIKVDKDSPSISFKTGNFNIYTEEEKEASSYFDYSFSVSGGTVKCTPSNTQFLSIGSQKISCTVTGGNGKTASDDKTLIVKPSFISKASGSCFRKGRKCSISEIQAGVYFNVAVNDNETIRFYVLADDGEKVTAIASKNIGNDFAISKSMSSDGPTVAIQTLKNRTSSWHNLSTIRLPYAEEIISLTNFYQSSSNKSDWDINYVNNELQSLLGSITEDDELDTRNKFIEFARQKGYSKLIGPSFLYAGLSESDNDGRSEGYYLVNSKNTNSGYAWLASSLGLPLPIDIDSTAYGVRPVIEISKEKIG